MMLPVTAYASSQAAVNATAPAYEPILLASKLGEMCSQCVAALVCSPMPGGGAAATIYLFPVKTVWQQIMTIPTYLPFIGKPEIDMRPVIAYAPATNDAGTAGEAGLDFNRASVQVQGAVIDRRSGAWKEPGGATLGQCRPGGRTLAEARAALGSAAP